MGRCGARGCQLGDDFVDRPDQPARHAATLSESQPASQPATSVILQLADAWMTRQPPVINRHNMSMQ